MSNTNLDFQVKDIGLWTRVGHTVLAVVLMPVAVTLMTAVAVLMLSPFDSELVALWTLLLGWMVAYGLTLLIFLPGHLIYLAIGLRTRRPYVLLGLFTAALFYAFVVVWGYDQDLNWPMLLLPIFPIGATAGAIFWWLVTCD